MDEKKFEELLLKNNEYLIKEIDKAKKELKKELKKEFKKEIKKSEERQNEKLAYLEFNYGEKISAIFDKIQSMEEIMKRNEKENQKYRRIVNHHSDILYSHNLRISDIENKFSSN